MNVPVPGAVCEAGPVGECGDIGVLGESGPVWDWGDMRFWGPMHPGPAINILFMADEPGIPTNKHLYHLICTCISHRVRHSKYTVPRTRMIQSDTPTVCFTGSAYPATC